MKSIKIIVCFLVSFFFFNLNCNASVNSYTRTDDNLLVPKDVVVDSNNIDAIRRTPAVSSSEKIYDYADLLTEDEEKKIYSKLYEYTKDSNIDVAVITTNDLFGFSIVEYANNFYDYNDFMNDGIVFVMYMSGSEPEIYMGNSGDYSGKVFEIYTDVRINQTLEYVYKDIAGGSYYKAVDDYIKILDGFYRMNDGNYKVDKEGRVVKSIPWIEIVVLSVALTFIIVVILFYKLNGKKNVIINLEKNINTSTLMVRTDSDKLFDNGVSNN
ncbi:MAG: TPM domain-containing protein [Bacilli bacterium]|nr:TPM domain-containing protein [Bacilli bacterium]